MNFVVPSIVTSILVVSNDWEKVCFLELAGMVFVGSKKFHGSLGSLCILDKKGCTVMRECALFETFEVFDHFALFCREWKRNTFDHIPKVLIYRNF